MTPLYTKFFCPHCNKKCAAGEELIGCSVECPGCGISIEVPPPMPSPKPQISVQVPLSPRAITPSISSTPRVGSEVSSPMVKMRVPKSAANNKVSKGGAPKKGKFFESAFNLFLGLCVIGGGYAAFVYYQVDQTHAYRGLLRDGSALIRQLYAALSGQTSPAVAPRQSSSPTSVTVLNSSAAISQPIENLPPAWQADQGDGTFKNPVLYADYCDPDIIRVGSDFYMVSSTFVNSPGINLLNSKDMVNWELLAHVASRVDGGDKFDMKGATAYQEGYWAPSIRFHNGTFYVAVQPTFAAGRIYYATNPAGPWKYYQLDKDIYDPGLFIDDDGTGYVLCGHGPQKLVKLSPDFSHVVEERMNFLNSGGEGSHMVKRGHYYYAFNANPGVWPFQLRCSRSTSLTNPNWETRVALTAITGGHQGAVVEVDDNDHWYGFVHHDSGAIGRMTQIGPVFWENDWPIFGTPEHRDMIADRNPKPIQGMPVMQPATSDDFSAPNLGLQWSWNHNPDNGRWSLTEHPGFLRLHPTKADDFWTARNTLTQKAQGPACQGVVKLDLSGLKVGDVAGFGTLGKVNAHLFVTVDSQGNKTLGMQMIKDKVGSYVAASGIALSSDTLYMKVKLDFIKNLGTCAYSADGVNWTSLGGNFELMFGYGSTFQGEQFAIFCCNPNTAESSGYLDVDSFAFSGLDKNSEIQIQRGRPHLNAQRTTFVADNGQLLRGPYGSTEWTKAPSIGDIEVVKQLGFNTIHLYAECFDPKYPAPGSTAPGYSLTEVDKYVEMTRNLGLYLVITIGNGGSNGKYNQQWITDFWKLYGARYAKETHVLYEVQNEPVQWGPPYIDPKASPPGALDMEVAAYKTIRAGALETPILLFSYSVFGDDGGGQAALKDLDAFNGKVGGDRAAIWNNAAVAFHGYAGHLAAPIAVKDLLSAGYPCFMTEFISPTWGDLSGDGQDIELTAALEHLGISWITFLTVPPGGVSPLVTHTDAFKDRVEASGLSWTPDYGTWPVEKGVFSNNGMAWATPNTRVHDVLQGTFHLEAEDFDKGGQDVAYHDTDNRTNAPDAYRPKEGVDIETISDGIAGRAVRCSNDGSWLNYTVYIREPGYYQFSLRYATDKPGSSIRLFLGGNEKIPETLLFDTASSTWTTFTKTVFLEYGQKVLHLEIPKGGCELNWMELNPTSEGPLPAGIYKMVNRGSGMAMTNITKGNMVQQNPFNGANNQMWKLDHLGAGQYRISSLEDKCYWTVGAGEGKPINLVWWGGDKPGPQQRFVIRSNPDGYFRIAPVDLGIDLDIKGSSIASGADVEQDRYAGRADQEWAIQPADALSAPGGFAAERKGSNQVALSWNGVSGAIGYVIKCAHVSGGPYQILGNVPSGQTSAIAPEPPASKSLFYVVSAVRAHGESLNSAEVSPAVLRAFLKLDEGSGTTAQDASGNGLVGTIHGAQWVTDNGGSAVSLSGNGDYISLPPDMMKGLTDFSITAWVNLDSLVPWSRLFDFGTGTSSYMFLVPSDSFGNKLRFAIKPEGAGEQVITSSKTLPVGEWVHLAVVLNQGVGILYVNGEEVGRNPSLTTTPSALGQTTQNYIGKSQFPDPNLKGKLSDFRIYGTALNPSQVQSLAKARRPVHTR